MHVCNVFSSVYVCACLRMSVSGAKGPTQGPSYAQQALYQRPTLLPTHVEWSQLSSLICFQSSRDKCLQPRARLLTILIQNSIMGGRMPALGRGWRMACTPLPHALARPSREPPPSHILFKLEKLNQLYFPGNGKRLGEKMCQRVKRDYL